MISRARILLLEGTCGAGKTTLGKALTGEGDVFLSQRYTYAPLVPAEDAGTLSGEENRRFLLDRLQEIRGRVAELSKESRIIIDTFHVTQRVRPGVLTTAAFREIDESLAELGCGLLFLSIPAETIHERLVEGRRDTGFATYAARLAGGEAAVSDYFVREQAELRRVAREESKLLTRWISGVGECVGVV